MLSDSDTHVQTGLSGAVALWPYFIFHALQNSVCSQIHQRNATQFYWGKK